MVREDKRRNNSSVHAGPLRGGNVPGLCSLAKQERKHNEGKRRVWQVLGGRGPEGSGLYSGPLLVLFTPKVSTEVGHGKPLLFQEVLPAKEEGHRTGRVSRRWGWSVTSPYTNIWVPTQGGENGFLAFQLLIAKREGR